MKNQIKTHKGLIVSVSGSEALVELTDSSGGESCGSCALSSVCRPGKTDEAGTFSPIVVKASVPASLASGLHKGSRVVVEASARAARTAIMTLLVVPLAVLLVGVVALAAAGVPEWASALGGVAASGLSYFCISAMRRGNPPSWTIVEESQK